MKHLNLELEKLEQRIAPGMFPAGVSAESAGSHGGEGSKSAHSKSARSNGGEGEGSMSASNGGEGEGSMSASNGGEGE